MTISIAIIDSLGLPYDGNTIEHRGLGGSESAVIRISRQLAKIGFNVTVFNRCSEDDCKPGEYDNVVYLDPSIVADKIPPNTYDIIISSRSVHPFTDPLYRKIMKTAKYKVLWMHDTFVQGSDHVVEKMLMDEDFDRIFTLSDFHTDYVTTCDHGNRRNFEVLKNKIWQTRNGADAYYDYVDIYKKDPDLFVFNASYTKGMYPMVMDIWPKFKQRVPNAKLIVIGGFYRFPDRQPDQQELDWRELIKLPHKDVVFTGVIKQDEIATILRKASFFCALGGFPETFGISILEALLCNTPIIACRFGAAEQTAITGASYLMDYAVEPNSLFPGIPKDRQVTRYVDLMCQAHSNRYLWQQKATYCNIVRPIAGWHSVALQWKLHFYAVLGMQLPTPEYQHITWVNERVQTIFNQRFTNWEQM